MEWILNQIRTKHQDIKIIFSEITPRNDARDSEVMAFNGLLDIYAKKHPDVTIVFHNNLRDPNWSMFKDVKHIRQNKIPKFAANIISGLKQAYGISNISELFGEKHNSSFRNYEHPPMNEHIGNKFRKMAGYNYHQKPNQTISNDNEVLKKEIMHRLQDAIKSVFV